MAGVWPNLDAADLETRVRTYLNEVSASFYSQAEIWRWLSIAAKDIAQKTLCIRRVLDAVTVSGVRNVATNAYKVIHVEYIPSAGPAVMLSKIDPLRVGHYPVNGTTPQYWFEFGDAIGIEPLPNEAHYLRLYVADLPKMANSTYPIATWNSGWTGSGTGTFTNGASVNAYTGTTGQAGIDTYGTSITSGAIYTFTITISGIFNCGLVIKAGTAASTNMKTNGTHSVTVLSNGTGLTLCTTMTGSSGGLTVDNLYILKEGNFVSTADQIELTTQWQHLLVLYATYSGLYKDRKYAPAQMLEDIYSNELAYLRNNIIEIIPDGRSTMKYL
jgi:hypothetical protein